MLTKFLGDVKGGAKALAMAGIKDLVKKYVGDLENLSDAMAAIVNGDGAALDFEGVLSATDEPSQRQFLHQFMVFISDLGKRAVILIDNYEDANASGRSFVHWLLHAKPDDWIVIVVNNSEQGTEPDWSNKLSPRIAINDGSIIKIEPLSKDAIADWFEDELNVRPSVDELAEVLQCTSGGRPKFLKKFFSAKAQGLSYSSDARLNASHRTRRLNLTTEARRVCELLCITPRRHPIPRELLSIAASYYGVENVEEALDQLEQYNEIELLDDDTIRLYDDGYHESWANTLTAPKVQKVIEAWYEVYIRREPGQLRLLDRSGIISTITDEIVAKEDGAILTQIATELREYGSSDNALAIIDASWQVEGQMTVTSDQVIDHALVSAKVRLELGQYGRAFEALETASQSKGLIGELRVRALLLKMKLALRKNSYSSLQSYAAELAEISSTDMGVMVERELILNTSYRDLLDMSNMEISTGRLVDWKDTAPQHLAGKLYRAIARSYAKLGRTGDAELAANSAMALADEAADLRAIGNSYLALGEAHRYSGSFDQAASAYLEGEKLARGIGNRDSEIWCVLGRTSLEIQRRNFSEASQILDAAIRLVREDGYSHPLEAAHTRLLGHLAQAKGCEAEHKSISSLYETLGISWPKALLENLSVCGELQDPLPI